MPCTSVRLSNRDSKFPQTWRHKTGRNHAKCRDSSILHTPPSHFKLMPPQIDSSLKGCPSLFIRLPDVKKGVRECFGPDLQIIFHYNECLLSGFYRQTEARGSCLDVESRGRSYVLPAENW